MNRIVRTICIAAMIGLLAGPRAVAQGVPGRGDSLVLRVDGMVCSLCAFGVERRLRRLAGVEHVSVDLERHTVVVTVRPGVAVADSQLHREVTRAGFALREIARHSRPAAPPVRERP
jgi:mercuric ion binding protein